jgi:hypothetical protein
MSYSKVHLRFANYYPDNPDTLTNPEKFLGPNWETVLNYWKYLDKLLPDDFKHNFVASPSNYKSKIAEWAMGITPQQASAWAASYLTYSIHDYYGWATVELIAMHKILEEGESLFFVPQLFNN